MAETGPAGPTDATDACAMTTLAGALPTGVFAAAGRIGGPADGLLNSAFVAGATGFASAAAGTTGFACAAAGAAGLTAALGVTGGPAGGSLNSAL